MKIAKFILLSLATWATASTMLFGIDLPKDPQSGLDPTKVSLPQKEGSIIGLRGSTDVSGNIGDANYTYDFRLPKWRGIVPALGLHYTSTGGNGIVGQGFDLGIPHIQRLTRSGTPNSQYPYVSSLDKDLVVTADGSYRAKIDGSFHRYKIDGQTFVMDDGSGSTWTFGASDESRVSEGQYTFRWNLTEIKDAFGNRAVFQYTKKLQQSYLSKIQMIGTNGRVLYQLDFQYELSGHPFFYLNEGVNNSTDQLLSSVQLNWTGDANPQRIWKVLLRYNQESRPILENIQEFGHTDDDSYPLITLNYSKKADLTRLTSLAKGLNFGTQRPPIYEGHYKFIDFNGDGLPDILAKANIGDNNSWTVWYNRGQLGFEARKLPASMQGWNFSSWDHVLADLDGDRLMDLAVKPGSKFFAYLNQSRTPNPDSATLKLVNSTNTPDQINNPADGTWIDLNSDGRVDYLQYNAGKYRVYWNRTQVGLPVTFSVQEFPGTVLEPEYRGSAIWGDINGDGLADMVVYEPWSLRVKIRINRGNGRFLEPYVMSVSGTDATLPAYPLVRDIDSDGLADLVFWAKGEIPRIFSQKRSSFEFQSEVGAIGDLRPADITSIDFGDVNGNGSTDIILNYSASQTIRIIDPYEFLLEKRPYILKKVANQLGSSTLLSYGSSIQADQPSPGHQLLQEQVIRATVAGPKGLLKDQLVQLRSYEFANPVFDYIQNDFLGFQTATIDSWLNAEKTEGMRTISRYHTSEAGSALKGLKFSVDSYTLPTLRLVSSAQTEWTALSAVSRVVVPFAKSQKSQKFEADGTKRNQQSQAQMELNAFGYPLRDDQTTLIQGTPYRSVSTEYLQTDHWLTNIPTSITVLDGSDSTKILQAKRFTYHSPTPILKSAERWDGKQWLFYTAIDIDDSTGLVEAVRTANNTVTHLTYEGVDGYLPTEVWIDHGDIRLSKKYKYNMAAMEKVREFRDENQPNEGVLYTNYQWDGLGRLKSITQPGEQVPTYRYEYQQGSDASYSVVRSYMKDISRPTLSLYDSMMREVAMLQPNEIESWVVSGLQIFGPSGRFDRSYRPFLAADERSLDAPDDHADSYIYDDESRVRAINHATGGKTETVYSALSKTTINPELEKVTEFTDELQRIVAVEQDKARIEVKRSKVNLITEMLLPNGDQRFFEYDGLQRLLRSSSPKIGSQEFAYSASDVVTTRRTFGAKGEHVGTTFQFYDDMDREISRRYFYDAPGDINNPLQVEASKKAFEFSYDRPANFVNRYSNTLGRLSRIKIDDQFTISFGYNDQGTRSFENFNGTHQLVLDYDVLNRMQSVTYPDNTKATYLYSGIGHLTGISSSFDTSFAYDEFNRLRDLNLIKDTSTIRITKEFDDIRGLAVSQTVRDPQGQKIFSQLIKEFDRLDRVRAIDQFDIKQRDLSKVYSYDGRGQLTGENVTQGSKLLHDNVYAYDTMGLLASKGQAPVIRNPEGIRWKDQEYTMGSFGRVDQSPTFNHSVWNAEGQIDSLSLVDGNTARFRYMPDLKRFSETLATSTGSRTTYYPSSFYEVDATSGSIVKYLFAQKVRIASESSEGIRYLIGDHLGTNRMTLSPKGDVQALNDYEPFGEKTFKLQNDDFDRYQFADGLFDKNAKFYHLQARNYDPHLGQFLSPDPLYFNDPDKCLRSPIECNLYSYARNNPLKYVDPSGTVTIVATGTWAENADWAQPNSAFSQAVSETYKEEVNTFTWSGGNNAQSRTEAAHQLAEYINSPAISERISAGEPLNIVAHSHGGNVVKEYSNLPSAKRIDNLVTLGTPQREHYQINRGMVGSYINAFSKSDFVQANGTVLDSPGKVSSSTMDKIFSFTYGLFGPADSPTGNGRIDTSAKNIEVPGMSHSEMRSVEVWNQIQAGK